MPQSANVNKVLILFTLFLFFPLHINFSADIKYQIKPGDTLYSIARRYDIDHKALMNANKIQDERSLKVGQVITIPQESTYDLEDYEIQGGDTIYSISRRTGMSIQEILDFNNLNDDDDIIKPGQVLHLRPSPGSAPSESQTAGSQTANSSSSEKQVAAVPTSLTSRGASSEAGASTASFWPHTGERFVLEGKFPGIVIKGNVGDDIRAVSSGRVVYSGPHSTLANVAFIQNGRGYIYIYGGNRNLLVSTGDEVKTGQVIGNLGSSPLLPEVQVYFSVWKEGKYIDPSVSLR